MANTPATVQDLAALRNEVEGIITSEGQTLRAAVEAQRADFTQRSEATVGMLQAELKQANDETQDIFAKKLKEKEIIMRREMVEAQEVTANKVEELEDAISQLRLENKAATTKIEELETRHVIGTPPASGNPGYFGDKAERIKTMSMDKLGLAKFNGDPGKFREWRESLDIELDAIWPGLAEVLEVIKSDKEEMTASRFSELVDEKALKPSNAVTADWDIVSIGRYVFRVLHFFCDGDAENTVKEAADGKKGLEAYRLLSQEFDKYGIDTAAGMMADIMMVGQISCESPQAVARAFKELEARTRAYEKRIEPLIEFRRTTLPGLALNICDEVTKEHLALRAATGSFSEMRKALDEYLLIKGSTKKPKKVELSKGLRQLAEEPMEPEAGQEWSEDQWWEYENELQVNKKQAPKKSSI